MTDGTISADINIFTLTAAPPGWYAMYFTGERDESGTLLPPTFIQVVGWASAELESGDISIFGYGPDADPHNGISEVTLECRDGFLCYLEPAASAAIIARTTGLSAVELTAARVQDLMRHRISHKETVPPILPPRNEKGIPQAEALKTHLGGFLRLADDFITGVAIGLSLGDDD